MVTQKWWHFQHSIYSTYSRTTCCCTDKCEFFIAMDLWLHNSESRPESIGSGAAFSNACTGHTLMIVTTWTKKWANAQRNDRPAEYRWRPLFNAVKFGWRPLLECHAVMLPRRETHWNKLGCPKLMKRSQPLVGRGSPYCEDMWGRYCCLTTYFPIVDMCLCHEDIARQSCAMVPRWRFFGNFLHPVFSASRV